MPGAPSTCTKESGSTRLRSRRSFAKPCALLRLPRLQLLDPRARLLHEAALRKLLEIKRDLVGVVALLDRVPELLLGLAGALRPRRRPAGPGKLIRRFAGRLRRLALGDALQGLGEGERGGEALIGLLGERARDHAVDVRRNLPHGGGPGRLLLDDLRRQRKARALERLLPGEHVIEKHARGED